MFLTSLGLERICRFASCILGACSRWSPSPYPTLSCVIVLPEELCREFRKLELNVITPEARPMLCTLEPQPILIEEIRLAPTTEPQLQRIREEILVGKVPGFVIHEDGTIRFHNRVCVPAIAALKKKILDEGHNTPHSVHSGEISCIRSKTNVLVE